MDALEGSLEVAAEVGASEVADDSAMARQGFSAVDVGRWAAGSDLWSMAAGDSVEAGLPGPRRWCAVYLRSHGLGGAGCGAKLWLTQSLVGGQGSLIVVARGKKTLLWRSLLRRIEKSEVGTDTSSTEQKHPPRPCQLTVSQHARLETHQGCSRAVKL